MSDYQNYNTPASPQGTQGSCPPQGQQGYSAPPPRDDFWQMPPNYAPPPQYAQQQAQDNGFWQASPNYSAPPQNPYEDPGKGIADQSMIFGILFLFIFPIVFCILGLVKSKEYQRVGNGANASKANVGKICSIISIVLQALGVLAVIGYIVAIAVFAAGAEEMANYWSWA